MFSNLGKKPAGEILEKIKKSSNYIDGAFRNREKPTPDLKMKHPAKIAFDYFTKPRDVLPHGEIPILKPKTLRVDLSETPSFLWWGHSSYFIFWENFKILIDPVLSQNASPIYNTNVAFAGTSLFDQEEIPHIDILILTHDHFDHLDFYTIRNLHSRIRKIVCPIGMESHLIYWGVAPEKIHSLDWDESVELEQDIKITSLTTRHNSGRTWTRNQTLWSAYALQLSNYNIFIAGDGGYGSHFQEIGNQYGPFDFGTIENGQYNTAWPKNHMFPEQSAKAAHQLGIQHVIPIHWGRFALSTHVWNESIRRFATAAEKYKFIYSTPMIGQQLYIDQIGKSPVWWDFE